MKELSFPFRQSRVAIPLFELSAQGAKECLVHLMVLAPSGRPLNLEAHLVVTKPVINFHAAVKPITRLMHIVILVIPMLKWYRCVSQSNRALENLRTLCFCNF